MSKKPTQTNLHIPFEIKRLHGNSIEGHGAVFGNVDLGGDIVMHGAFKASLAEHHANGTRIKMLWQHDSARPIGVWTEASEDETGLLLKGEFADTADGRDARTLTKMQAIDGLSIGFSLIDFDFDNDGNRLIKEAALWETSIVTFPMNPAATITAVKSDPRFHEAHLRDAGMSKREAKVFLSDLKSDSAVTVDQTLRDAETEVDERVAEGLEALREGMTAGMMRQIAHKGHQLTRN